jgi:transporter family protein
MLFLWNPPEGAMPDTNDARTGWLLFALGSAVFAALTAILGKLGVSEVNSDLATLIRTAVILVVAAVVVTARGAWEPLGRVSRFGATMLVLSGVATGLSWLCYYRALQLGPASRVAPVDKLSVALVVVLAALFLGEPLSGKVVLGAALVVAGVLVLAS